jgi:hypothetical protein
MPGKNQQRIFPKRVVDTGDKSDMLCTISCAIELTLHKEGCTTSKYHCLAHIRRLNANEVILQDISGL